MDSPPRLRVSAPSASPLPLSGDEVSTVTQLRRVFTEFEIPPFKSDPTQLRYGTDLIATNDAETRRTPAGSVLLD